MKTMAQLEAENAALRDLLDAIAAAADVPVPADASNSSRDMLRYRMTLERRIDVIAVYAEMDDACTGDIAVAVLQDRATEVRKETARPLRYQIRAEEVLQGEIHSLRLRQPMEGSEREHRADGKRCRHPGGNPGQPGLPAGSSKSLAAVLSVITITLVTTGNAATS